MPSILVSYERDHAPSEAVVRELDRELGDDYRLLRDVHIAPGEPWSRELYARLLECDAGIAIVSDAANSADWCRRESTFDSLRDASAGRNAERHYEIGAAFAAQQRKEEHLPPIVDVTASCDESEA